MTTRRSTAAISSRARRRGGRPRPGPPPEPGRRRHRQAGRGQDRRLQDLAGRVVAAQGPLQAKEIDNLDFPKIAREQYGIEGVEFVNQFFKDKAHDSAYLKDLKKPRQRPRRDLRPDHDRRRGRPQRRGQGRARPRPSRTTRSGSTPPRRSAATRSASTPASNYSPTNVEAVAEACAALAEYGDEEQDQHHLREPRRPVEQPRRPARPDQGREQARASAPCPTSATSPRTGTASTRSTSTTRSPG